MEKKLVYGIFLVMAKYWDDTTLKELIELLAKEELYLFAGAGLSCLAGLPRWSELLEKIADIYIQSPNAKPEVVSELQSNKKYDLRVINLVSRLPQSDIEKYCNILTEAFTDENIFHDCHKLLLELPFAGYITTNYDSCFDNACKALNSPRANTILDKLVIYPKHSLAANPDLSTIWACKPFLLHMHGRILFKSQFEIENIVLSMAQYSKYYNQENDLDHVFRNCLQKNVLIVGAGLTDTRFMGKFEGMRCSESLNNTANRKRSYVVCHKDELQQDPEMTKEVFDMVYNAFDSFDNGLSNMITELYEAFRDSKKTVLDIQKEVLP